MDQGNPQSNNLHLLTFEEIKAIAPNLSKTLNEETTFEFSKQLYEFTKLILEQHKNEKEKPFVK